MVFEILPGECCLPWAHLLKAFMVSCSVDCCIFTIKRVCYLDVLAWALASFWERNPEFSISQRLGVLKCAIRHDCDDSVGWYSAWICAGSWRSDPAFELCWNSKKVLAEGNQHRGLGRAQWHISGQGRTGWWVDLGDLGQIQTPGQVCPTGVLGFLSAI